MVVQRLSGRLDNLTATASPTTGDDVGDGYSVGSMWIWSANGWVWVCTSAAAGAAVWKELTPEIVYYNGTLGGGTYSTTSTSYGDIDAAMNFSFTVPSTGKFLFRLSTAIGGTTQTDASIALTDTSNNI